MLANSLTKSHKRKRPQDEVYSNPARGAEVQVSARCSPTRGMRVPTSEDIFVPWSLQGLNDFIESLDSKLSTPLRMFYREERQEEAKGMWLDRAENAVMLR
jgi:hypothetical protein